MKIRFRSDSWHYADMKAQGTDYSKFLSSETDLKFWNDTPLAQPGDCWRIRWYKADAEGPIAGYAICCPRCKHVHAWTTATNCGSKREASWTDEKGIQHKYTTCIHSGVGSCWTWTGNAEDGTLSASPSLFASGACGWHGWLTNGDLHE